MSVSSLAEIIPGSKMRVIGLNNVKLSGRQRGSLESAKNNARSTLERIDIYGEK